jgi:DNA mismatch repair protein MutS
MKTINNKNNKVKDMKTINKNNKETKTNPQNESGIYNLYFNLTTEYTEKYGPKTCVLLQVGSFFEIYGLKDKNGEITKSNIEDICEICGLNSTEKKVAYSGSGSSGQIMMAGFRDFTLDKHISKMMEVGYTVPVFIQIDDVKGGKEKTRVLDKVYSSGTYISYEVNVPRVTNHIMSIWMELYKPLLNNSRETNTSRIRDTIVYGVSVINILTGKSAIYQYETAFYMNMTTFDELERYIATYNPSEILFLSPFDDADLQTILQMIHPPTHTSILHCVNVNGNSSKKVSRCCNQKYIRDILSVFYGEEAYDICSEFQHRIIATQSLCYLLDFIQEHNPDLVRKISIPEFSNISDRMLLANHTLSQLNIIDDNSSALDYKKTRLSSVLSFLNHTCSPMGKRRFQNHLTNPTFNEEWLCQEYEMTEFFLSEYELTERFRIYIRDIRDVEKMYRQIVVKRIYPVSFSHLYENLSSLLVMNRELFSLSLSDQVGKYLCSEFIGMEEDDGSGEPFEYIHSKCSHLLKYLESHFIIEKCKSQSSMTNFEENIIQRGVSVKLDEIIDRYTNSKTDLFSIQTYFNNLISTYEKGVGDTEYVKLHETEKMGFSLQITQKRSQVLKKVLEGSPAELKIGNISMKTGDVHFTKASSTMMDIDCYIIKNITKEILKYKDLMNETITKTYMDILKNIETEFFVEMENIAKYVAKLDVICCKAYIARTYNYCKPTIVSQSDGGKDKGKSFVQAKGLRHCLIEHIQKNEIYVTNDVELGKEDGGDGILLYGTNAVGKTSLIRALGIATIMAQAGIYVPCSHFHYRPYRAIFSRILGNDNLFKGLSTFAVEMSELRIILKMADQNSMILGDELCSGTELESALSIFITGLMNLHEKGSSFIFATHFHEIVNLEEIRCMERLRMKHMEVRYDRELDALIYDRKLKEGSGPRIYGLEVCKSLYLGDDFLDAAFRIRNKYYPDTRGELSVPPTTYNSNKIRGLCELCGVKAGEEVHHLQQQKNADENGFIDTFHKNHPANLINICKKCHDFIHSTDSGGSGSIDPTVMDKTKSPTLRKKTTKGYVLK